MDNVKLPAYPISITREWKRGDNGEMYEIKDDYEGLTKLEAFTMAAMQGLCANPKIVAGVVVNNRTHISCETDLEIAAVNIARITLNELQKQQP